MPVRLVAATRSGIAVADEAEPWRIEKTLEGEDVRSLVVASPACRLFAGTQGNGVFRSEDTGATWSRAGLAGEIVKALAVGPDGAVYAGTKPPALFVSRDAGERWLELEGFRAMRRWYWGQPAQRPHTPYVQALAVSPIRAGTILAGIEAFRVLRSDDGGQSWIRLRRGVSIDCHDLTFHPADGDRVYEGAGLGASTSSDAGRTWTRAAAGLDRRYVMSLAVDPADPNRWYVGAPLCSRRTAPTPMPVSSVGPATGSRSSRAGFRRSSSIFPPPSSVRSPGSSTPACATGRRGALVIAGIPGLDSPRVGGSSSSGGRHVELLA
jgi:hypothetical protein